MKLTQHKDNINQNFTVISNDLISDRSISSGAFCVMSYVLTKSDDYQLDIHDLCRQMRRSKQTVYGFLGELKKAGYVAHKSVRDEEGRFIGRQWFFYGCKSLNPGLK